MSLLRDTMRISVNIRSFDTYGANPTYCLVGLYLGTGLQDYGSAVRDLEVIPCFRGGRVKHASMQESYDRFHYEYLPALPRVKFYRKKAHLVLEYETRVADASFVQPRRFLAPWFRPRVRLFSNVVREMAEVLHLVDNRFRKSDDFDLAQFHQDVSSRVSELPQSARELRTLQAKLEKVEQERIAAMGPWRRLDIDWESYHSTARNLLDDPFFWDEADDYSPHGNDTGADLLDDFRRWNRRHPEASAHLMARNWLGRERFGELDWNLVDESEVESLLGRDASALTITNEAIIAAAFAAVKLRGGCDRETLDFAMKAIKREQVIVDKHPDPPQRRMKLALLERTLSRVPELQG